MTSFFTLLIALITAILPLSLTTPTESTPRQPMPVKIVYCEKDPGSMLDPSGARDVTAEELKAEFGCIPAEGVGVTFVGPDGFFTRCDTDEDGTCQVTTPTGPDYEMDVNVHFATVTPGYSTTENLITAVNYTEFAAVGIALLPVTEGVDFPDEHRTVAFEMSEGDEPMSTHGQLSEGEVPSGPAAWLSTNDEGWVSFPIDQYGAGDIIDLRIGDIRTPDISCDTGEPEWLTGPEGDFLRLTIPEGDGNITCRLAYDGKE